MRKIFCVILLFSMISIAAFAEEGWGIGVVGSFGGYWGSSDVSAGGALSLKAPTIPIYWGVTLTARSGILGLGVTGDYPFLRGNLVPDINLDWYLNLGGWGTFYTGSNHTSIALGARAPLGLSWRIPKVEIIEIFLSLSPSIGVAIDFDDGIDFPAGGWPVELGFRIWF